MSMYQSKSTGQEPLLLRYLLGYEHKVAYKYMHFELSVKVCCHNSKTKMMNQLFSFF